MQRHGRKGYAFFHIVAADSRAHGWKFIEVGVYNPNTNPATIDIDFDGALQWLEMELSLPTHVGPSFLTRAYCPWHLNGGVRKGAFTQEEADARFEKWMNDKMSKVQQGRMLLPKDAAKAEAMAEAAKKEEIAKKVAAKTSPLAEEAEAAVAEEEAVASY